jgi:ribosomal protein S18 acetylase RimI-like enzyme
MSAPATDRVHVRNTEPRDFTEIGALCGRVYPNERPWMPEQLASHLRMFPEGQFVALDRELDRVVGMSASLIVRWECYDDFDDWEDFTADGMFTNHDPVHGRTMYGAEVIVDPTLQGHGIGGKLYAARRELIERLRLPRIRGGARLRSYHSYARRMSAADYVVKVVHGQLDDQTLSFQLHEGFHVLAVVPHYLGEDPETLGYAALIEWLNPSTLEPHHVADRPTRFLHKDVAAQQLRGASRR